MRTLRHDLPAHLRLGLLEWPSVVAWLGSGEGRCVVRSGGIQERGGSGFQLAGNHFLMLPSTVHQEASRLSAAARAHATAVGDDTGWTVSFWAEVVGAAWCTDEAALASLSRVAAWSPSELAMRWAYRQRRALLVIDLRMWRLPTPCRIERTAEHAGCRSWLDQLPAVSLAGSTPVVAHCSDDQIASIMRPWRPYHD